MLVVGVLQAELRLRSSRNLKDKRRVTRSIKERMRARYNVSVAESDDQDLWQSIVLGFAVAGADSKPVVKTLEEITQHLRTHPEAELIDHEIDIM